MKKIDVRHVSTVVICTDHEYNSRFEEKVQYTFPELGFKKVDYKIYFNKEKGNLAKFLEYIYKGLVEHLSSDRLPYAVADPEYYAQEIIEELKEKMVEELYQKRLEDKSK